MAKTIEVVPAEQDKPRRGGGTPTRRTKVVVKKVGPWSVLRFSLLFYFCVMIAIWVGLIIVYNFLGAIGVLDSIEKWMRDLEFRGWAFQSGWIFTRLFMVGLVMVVFGSVVNLFAALLYNAISGFVGGIELTLTERR